MEQGQKVEGQMHWATDAHNCSGILPYGLCTNACFPFLTNTQDIQWMLQVLLTESLWDIGPWSKGMPFSSGEEWLQRQVRSCWSCSPAWECHVGPCQGSYWTNVWQSVSVIKPSYEAPEKTNPKCTDDNFTLTSSTFSSTSLRIPAQLPGLQQLACSLFPSIKASCVPSSCGTSSTSFNLSKSQKKVENLPSSWRRDDAQWEINSGVCWPWIPLERQGGATTASWHTAHAGVRPHSLAHKPWHLFLTKETNS